MNMVRGPERRLERAAGKLLGYGTATACGLTGAGMVLARINPGAGVDRALVGSGILLLLLLPVARVALMAGFFAWGRERRFLGIALLVLAIIAAGTLLGLVGQRSAEGATLSSPHRSAVITSRSSVLAIGIAKSKRLASTAISRSITGYSGFASSRNHLPTAEA